MRFRIFVDASGERHGGVLYGQGHVDEKWRILAAKSRANKEADPTEKNSTPRKELCAALLGVELAREQAQYYEEGSVEFRSDNKAVLSYLKNMSLPLPSFERERVKKILHHTEERQWTYIRTDKNPADKLTRWHC